MSIKVVTDSTADLPPQLAQEMGIVVVPAYVKFGPDVYRDRVDIGEDEFYQRMLRDPEHPRTDPPTPNDFARVYQELSREADGIISLHISSKLSATYNSALRGKELAGVRLPIEVVDSQLVTMGLGLLAIAAAQKAASGGSLSQLAEDIRNTSSRIHILGLLDTLKYLAQGGRIGKAKALLGSVLSVKPMLMMRDGEIEPAGQVRSRENGINRLIDFVKNAGNIEDLAIIYSTTPDEALGLAERMNTLFPREKIKLARLGPVLGAHAGPGILFVAFRAGSN
jgi:DegV family protein with EDD domain